MTTRKHNPADIHPAPWQVRNVPMNDVRVLAIVDSTGAAVFARELDVAHPLISEVENLLTHAANLVNGIDITLGT